MAGMPGRSGGHNRLSIAEHLQHGTYRADRHGALKPASPWPMAASTSAAAEVKPPAALLDGLGKRGRAFVRDVFAELEPNRVEMHVLRVAAEALDDAHAARDGGDHKASRAAVRQFLAACGRLGLPLPTERGGKGQ